MKINLNNLDEMTVAKNLTKKFAAKVEEIIAGNSEHFYLECDKDEIKFLRTEFSDSEIIKGSLNFYNSHIGHKAIKRKRKSNK